MRHVCFEVIDAKKRNARPCATLEFQEDRGWRIEICSDASAEEVPAFFIPFIEKGQLVIEGDWAQRWVDERIVPPGRQNLGEVLNAHELLEYDEISLLRSSKGCTSLDDYAVIELESEDSSASIADLQKGAREALGSAIQAQRTRLGLSQSDLAKRIGMHQSALSNIERGKTNITLNLLLEISAKLGTSIDRLLARKARFLWNEKRQDVLSLLMDVSEELGETYRRLVDELESYVDDDGSALADSIVISHCFRELLNAFPDYISRSSLTKGGQNDERLALERVKEKLDLIADEQKNTDTSYELIPRALGNALRQYKSVSREGTQSRKRKDMFSLYGSQSSIGSAIVAWEEVRNLAGRAHMQRSESPVAVKADTYLQALNNLEASIGTRLGNVLDSKSEVEKALRRANSVDSHGRHAAPQAEEVIRVLALLNENHLEWKFYSELRNPRWFSVLDRVGAFRECLTATTYQGSANDFLAAPFFRFCIENQPELVVRFIEDNAESDNFSFRVFVRDSAQCLPADLTQRIAWIFIRWIDQGFQFDSYYWTPEDILPCVKKLLSSDSKTDRRTGAKLFDKLVELHGDGQSKYSRSVRAFVNQYHYADFVSGALECMTPSKRFHECSSRIDEYLKLNQWNDEKPVSSHAVLPDLAPAESSFELSYRAHVYVWICELRKLLVTQLNDDVSLVKKWLDGAPPIVIRVALLSLRDCVEARQENLSFPPILELIETLIDSDVPYESEYEDEALSLLDASSFLLSPDLIARFLSQHHGRLLGAKSRIKERRLGYIQKACDAEKEAIRLTGLLSWRILSQFERVKLPAVWLRELQALERKYGPYVRIEHPYETVTITGPNSPYGVDVLQKMGPYHAIRFMTKWTPSRDENSRLIEPAGLASELEKLVKQTPDFFVGHYDELIKLQAVYVSGLLRGWNAAAEAGRSIPLGEVVEYCIRLLGNAGASDDDTKMSPATSVGEEGEIRIWIARLVESILDAYSDSIAETQYTQLLDVLEELATANPDIAEAEKVFEEYDDVLTASLNMLRPIALKGAGKWLVHAKDANKQDVKRAYDILDTALPKNVQSRAEIAALALIIGRLSDIDSLWLKDNRESLFGGNDPDANQRLLVSLVIDLYQPNVSLFSLIKPAVFVSLEKNGKGYSGGIRFHANKPFMKSLGEWVYWLVANEEVSMTDDVFTAWFERVDGEVRGSVLNHLCGLLENSPNAPNRIVRNIQNLWEHHRKTVSEAPESLKGATHLLASHRVDDEWAKVALLEEAQLGNLTERLMVFQDDVVNLMLADSCWGVDFLRAFLAFDSDRRFLYAYEEFVPTLLQNYRAQGGDPNNQALSDCKDKLARMGMLDVDKYA